MQSFGIIEYWNERYIENNGHGAFMLISRLRCCCCYRFRRLSFFYMSTSDDNR